MTWLEKTLLILGGIAGFALVAKLTLRMFVAYTGRALERAGFCQFCFRVPAELRIQLKDGPLNGCKPCMEKSASAAFLAHQWERGKITKIEESAAITWAQKKASGK